MSKTIKDCLFGIFGCGCKVSFFITSLITAYCYNKMICFILLCIFILHNVGTVWYMKGKKIKIKVE